MSDPTAVLSALYDRWLGSDTTALASVPCHSRHGRGSFVQPDKRHHAHQWQHHRLASRNYHLHRRTVATGTNTDATCQRHPPQENDGMTTFITVAVGKDYSLYLNAPRPSFPDRVVVTTPLPGDMCPNLRVQSRRVQAKLPAYLPSTTNTASPVVLLDADLVLSGSF